MTPSLSPQWAPATAQRTLIGAVAGEGRAYCDMVHDPILEPIHQSARQSADGLPRLALTSWGQLGRAGSRRLAAFLPARDGASAKISRREHHLKNSVIKPSMARANQKVCAECRKIYPNGRTVIEAKR